MRHDRTLMRLLKTAIFLGAVGLMVEGLFEIKLVVQPFIAPPSVPGQSKIIEHFLVQHLAFPALGFLLVFAPMRLARLTASRFAMLLLGSLAFIVTLPEAIVSQTDLFRPYPFELKSAALKAVQMADFGFMQLNVLQLQHLVFAHFALMGMIVALAIFKGPRALMHFAGPRTGEEFASTAPTP